MTYDEIIESFTDRSPAFPQGMLIPDKKTLDKIAEEFNVQFPPYI